MPVKVFIGGLTHHLQPGAECGAFVWLNDNVCKIPAFGSASLLTFLTGQLLAVGGNDTFALLDIREAFLNLQSVEFLAHSSFPEELPALPT